MSVSVLVATPHAAFGELLRISLQDSGPYQIKLVQSAKEARALYSGSGGSKPVYHLAIFDSALVDEPFIPLCMDLLQQQAGIRLIVIPPENNPNHPALGGLIPHAYLSRPFYLPDLLDTVSRLLNERERQVKAQNAAGPKSVPAAAYSATVPPWLVEPSTFQRYLSKELEKTQGLAALAAQYSPITPSPAGVPNTGVPLKAAAGRLDEASAQELAGVVFRYWNSSEKTDLMRYIRLTHDHHDYLVYATQITGELVLMMVYDNKAPVSQIRPQTKSMAQTLATLPPQNYQPLDPQNEQGGDESTGGDAPAQVPPTGGAAPSGLTTADAGKSISEPADDRDFLRRLTEGFDRQTSARAAYFWQAEDTPSPMGQAPPPEPGKSTNPGEDLSADDEPENDRALINLSELFGAIPPPDPGLETMTGRAEPGSHPDLPAQSESWIPERFAGREIPTMPGGLDERVTASEWSSPGAAEVEPPLPSQPQTSVDLPDLHPAAPNKTVPPSPPDEQEPASGTAFPSECEAETLAIRAKAAAQDVKTEPPIPSAGLPIANDVRHRADFGFGPEPPIDGEDTRPSVVTAVANIKQLEPVSPALALLKYTCVLIPRLPPHYLTGELADNLSQWIPQLCLAYGWRLEGIATRPEYAQWTVQVAPAVSPGNLVRIIRQRTSAQIFSVFPHLAEQNPSGDFWATGYLIVSGSQPPSAQLLRDYIAQTRKRQGIGK